MWATERKERKKERKKESESPCDSQYGFVRCSQAWKIFITEGNHSNITGDDAERSNSLMGCYKVSPPTYPPTYSVRKI